MFYDIHIFLIDFPLLLFKKKRKFWDFLDGPMVKNLPGNARDTGLIPGLGKSHMPGGI